MNPETGQERSYKYTVPSMEGGMNASKFRSDIIKEDDQLQMRELFNDYFGSIQTDSKSRDRIFGIVMRGIRR